MKSFILIFLSIILITNISLSNDLSPKAKEKLKEKMLNSNALGRYFVVAFPPNEIPESFPKQLLGMFIAASEETRVRITSPSGFDRSYTVPQMGVISVNTDNDLNWSMENREEDVVSKNGFVIESDKPISVYVINSKRTTSEGYLAIPVNAWGYEYIHCSYWDFNEARPWKTGFVVLASEDRTRITVELKGRGTGFTTLDGRTLNSSFSKNLDKGEIYMIQGTGQNRGDFDLTGSIIRANKPIAIISTHERCMIPPFTVTNGRDHLASMPPPVNTWGRNYVTIELDRGTDKGDYFRVVAGADNVTFEVRWYDKKTGAYLGFWDGVLAKKGDWDDFNKVSAQMPHNNESIRGISYFKSDKPIYVAQYSYSTNWDLPTKGNYDPFMFPVSLVEQFTTATIFQTPSNTSGDNEYLDNYLNLVILADAETEDERIELLKTLKMDGKQLSAAHPEVYGQKFPPLGTKYDNKLYWLVTEPEIGPHTLEGEVSFGGYIYGFASFDSYGWPAATAYRDLGDVDTLPPVFEIIEDCGYFEIRATEFRTFDIPEDCDTCLQQIDKGMVQLPTIIESENFTEPVVNYALEEDKSPNEDWYGVPIDYDLNYIVEVIDKKKDARIHFVQPDKTNENFADTILYYYADKLSLDDVVDFGLKRLYSTNEFKVNLVSDKDDETIINEIKFKNMNGNYYTVTEPTGTMTIPPKGQLELTIQYVPTREYLDAETYEDGQYDLDSLIIETECVEFAFPVKGQGGEPYMYISDWDNGTVPINTVLESNPGTTQNLYIQNYNRAANRPATFPLEVYGIEIANVNDETGALANLTPYSTKQGAALDANDMFATPYVLPHTNGNARVSFNRAEFNSPNTGLFERNVPFRSNAVNYLMPGGDVSDDTTSKWKTRVVNSAASISNELWNKERELRTADNSIKATVNGGSIFVTNTSVENVNQNNIRLKEISLNKTATGDAKFTSPDGNFRINLNTGTPFIRNLRDGNGNETLVPQGAPGNSDFEIPIEFTPQNPYNATSHIITESIFATVVSASGEETELEGTLTGEVYLPIINANGDESTDAVLINTIAPYTLQVTIQNVGYNGDLYVWDVADPDNNEFTYEPASAIDNTGAAVNLPTDANPWMIPVGETYTLFYNFTPTQVGTRTANVNITHSGDITGVEPVEDGVNTRQTATAVLQAPGRSTGFESTPLSLGPVLKCVDDTGIIEVANNGTDPITITAITLDDGTDLSNASEFEFTYNEGNNISTFVGVQIPANSTDEIEVRFIPSNLPMGVFTTTRNILISGSYNQDENPTTTSVVTGDALENIIAFTVNDNTNVRDLDPDLAVTDGNFNLGISVDLQTKTIENGWDEANITSISFKFRYKLNWLQPSLDPNGNYIMKSGPAANGWTFNVTSKELDPTDNEWEILTIEGNGNAISNDGVILYPYFNVKLPGLNSDSTDLEDIEPELYDITFGDRDFCIFNTDDKGFIDVQACAAVVRTIPILTGQFVNNITQTASSLELDYAVPFESDARIEVIDMNGNVVSIPVKEKKGMGFYKASIPLSELATGAHIVRYTAGPLSKIDKVIIVK